ncbi:hypothetical protein ACTNEY_15125 [Fusicatenibacter saccharivorans]|uniref:hypothetical protein n=1 Tax=Fusicatenibacter saccharivorans TaxID=1150298 RepID=UPI003F8CB9FF
MIQLEGLAGNSRQSFFYCSGTCCRFALFPAVSSDYSVSLLLTILFLVWYRVGKWGGLFFDFLPDRIRRKAISGLFGIDGSREPAGRSAVFDVSVLFSGVSYDCPNGHF